MSSDRLFFTGQRAFLSGVLFLTFLLFLMTAGSSFPLSLDEFERDIAALEQSVNKETPSADPRVVMEAVNRFCNLLQENGKSLFDLYSQRAIVCLDYGIPIFVHTLTDAKVMADLAEPEMVGKCVLFRRDTIGRFYIAEMNRLVRDKSSGWIEYAYLDSDSGKPIVNAAYACQCRLGDEIYVVYAKILNITKKQVLNLLAKAVLQR